MHGALESLFEDVLILLGEVSIPATAVSMLGMWKEATHAGWHVVCLQLDVCRWIERQAPLRVLQ